MDGALPAGEDRRGGDNLARESGHGSNSRSRVRPGEEKFAECGTERRGVEDDRQKPEQQD